MTTRDAPATHSTAPTQGRFKQFMASLGRQIQEVWSELVLPAAIRGLEEAAHWSMMAQRSLVVSGGLERLGWPPIHYSHQELHEELERILRANEPDMRTQVEDAIRRHLLRDHAGGLAADWRTNPILQSRQGVISDALACHDHQLWYAAVPLWYSLTEGILMEQIAPNAPRPGERGRRHVGVRQCLFLISTPHIDLPAWNGIKAFSKKQAWVTYLGSPDSPANSRHGVMHGKSTDYGTSENALKAMLLFDFVQASLRTGVIEQDGFIHAAGCNELTAHPEDLIYFQNQWWGMAFGQLTQKPTCQACRNRIHGRLLHPRTTQLLDARYPDLLPERVKPEPSHEP